MPLEEACSLRMNSGRPRAGLPVMYRVMSMRTRLPFSLHCIVIGIELNQPTSYMPLNGHPGGHTCS